MVFCLRTSDLGRGLSLKKLPSMAAFSVIRVADVGERWATANGSECYIWLDRSAVIERQHFAARNLRSKRGSSPVISTKIKATFWGGFLFTEVRQPSGKGLLLALKRQSCCRHYDLNFFCSLSRKILAAGEKTWYFFQTISSPDSNLGLSGRKQTSLSMASISLSRLKT